MDSKRVGKRDRFGQGSGEEKTRKQSDARVPSETHLLPKHSTAYLELNLFTSAILLF